MELLNFSSEQFKIFILVLIRVSIFFYMFPIFGSSLFPSLIKAGLALVISLVLLPITPVDLRYFPDNFIGLLVLMVSELFVGLVLGLCLHMFFASVQLAGQLIGAQMGFAIINVMDPQSGEQVSIIDQFGYLVVILIFLQLNGHHILIYALAESFHLVDIGWIFLKKGFLLQVISLSTEMFILAIKIASPVIAALLFTSAAFGICAKFVPQMNIFITAFPVQIVIGLIFFGVSLQLIAAITRSFLHRFPDILHSLLIWMGTG